MTFKVVTDVNTGESKRVPVAADDLQQDTPEQHKARMDAPKPLTVAERLDALETKLAAIEARATK